MSTRIFNFETLRISYRILSYIVGPDVKCEIYSSLPIGVSFALQDKSQITVGLQNAISKVITNQKQEYRTDLHQKTQKEMKRMGVIMFKQKRQ